MAVSLFSQIPKSTDSFQVIFDEYYQTLCVFANKYLNDEVVASDIVQEAFLKYWKKQPDFQHTLQIKSYLYTVVKNDCLNFLRNNYEKRRDISEIEDFTFLYDTILENEVYHILYKAVDTLSPQAKKVILFTLDGLKNAEIAEKMNIAESSVHTHKKLAYKKLRDLLKDYYYILFIF